MTWPRKHYHTVVLEGAGMPGEDARIALPQIGMTVGKEDHPIAFGSIGGRLPPCHPFAAEKPAAAEIGRAAGVERTDRLGGRLPPVRGHPHAIRVEDAVGGKRHEREVIGIAEGLNDAESRRLCGVAMMLPRWASFQNAVMLALIGYLGLLSR